MKKKENGKQVGSKLEVMTFLDKLQYAIKFRNSIIVFQKDRKVDLYRDNIFSNTYTIFKLFPDENEVVALKRELLLIVVEAYIATVQDATKCFLFRRFHRILLN